MKIAEIIPVLVLSGAVVFIAGCGRQESTTSPPAAPMEKASEAPAAEMPRSAVAEAPAPALAAPPAPEVAAAPSAATDQAQGLIDKVKSLVAAKKYTEAATVLKDLSALELTPGQQQLVDSLQAQVQKALLADAVPAAGKAVGELLNK